ncbi:hypothetical protein Tco_0591701 [Tanacetum coccineum]
MAKQCTQPKRPRSYAWFKEKLMLAEAQEAGQILDEEKLAFIADPRIAEVQEVQEMSYFEQTYIVDFSDNKITSDSNIIPYSQYLKESQDANNLDKENQTNKMVNESLTAERKRDNERVAIFKQRLNVDLNKREKLIDSQIDDLIRNRNAKFVAFQQEIDTLKETLSNQAQQIKPTLYDGSVIDKEHDVISVIDDEETLILEEES